MRSRLLNLPRTPENTLTRSLSLSLSLYTSPVMEKENLHLQHPSPIATTSSSAASRPPVNIDQLSDGGESFADDYSYIDSNCSTPYVSAPSSPGRTFPSSCTGGGGYYYSAPASPMHFILSKSKAKPKPSSSSSCSSDADSFEFQFSARFASSSNNCEETAAEIGSMSSADELFLNGQIRPMKLSSHLQKPQFFTSLNGIAESDGDGAENKLDKGSGDVDGGGGVVLGGDGNGDGDVFHRSRELRLRDKSLRRRARSMSPMRTHAASFDYLVEEEEDEDDEENEKLKLGGMAKMMLKAQQKHIVGQDKVRRKGEATAATDTDEPAVSADTTPSSSRCSSAGRSSKRWVFLKDFLRSKSEGRNNVKFWSNISFSPAKEKEKENDKDNDTKKNKEKKSSSSSTMPPKKKAYSRPMNGVRMGKPRVPPSAHELHYTANRAQAEEMRKKTYLPYRQGLLGCLGFSSRSYGAMNGFARALNPVSSR